MTQHSARQTDYVSRRQLILATGAVGVAGLAGCLGSGGDDDGNSNNGNSNGDTENLSGNIRISGSSTVYPVATAVGELFQEDHSEVTFDISRDGSSGGFENVFIPGDADINNASRRITASEVQQIRDNGFEPVEFEVARDALTVVVNTENDWVDGLTYDQLEAIWSPEAPELWSDVNSAWPDEPFDLFGPASTSGTFDYFTETILGEAGRIRDDFEGTEEDDLIAEGVQGNPYALGYLPFAYYTNNPDETTAVALAESAEGDFTEPSLEAASTGEYPLARPLFFYANDTRVQEKNHLQEFISFYIDQTTREDLIAEEIGYVPSSDDRAQTNHDRLQAAIDDEYEHPF